MNDIEFDRPVGPAADLMELEYVSAVHQTGEELRRDGTIRAIDIKHFLMSRFGVVVTEDEVRDVILSDMAGSNDEEETVDLPELVAMLLIPQLIEAARENNAPEAAIIKDVLRMMLEEAMLHKAAAPVAVDADVVKLILSSCGESEMADDEDLIRGMVLAATGGEQGIIPVLDEVVFLRALTSDVVESLNVDAVKSSSASTYDMVCNSEEKPVENVSEGGSNSETDSKRDVEADATGVPGFGEEAKREKGGKMLKRVYTACSIDYVAESYMSKPFVVITWLGLTFSYFAYSWTFDEMVGKLECSKQNPVSFGCMVAGGIVNWSIIMLQLSIFGSLFVGLTNFGNGAGRIWGICIGTIFVILFFFVPYFVELGGPLFQRSESSIVGEFRFSRTLSLVCGCVLILIQAKSLATITAARAAHEKRQRSFECLRPTGEKLEIKMKQAATLKTNQLVKNALAMHDSAENEEVFLSDIGVESPPSDAALVNFMNTCEKTERIGGILWTWKQCFSGELFSKEGIWLHSRIITANCAQLLMTVVVLWGGAYQAKVFIKNAYDEQPDDSNVKTAIFSAAEARNTKPEKWMLMVSMGVGVGCAFIACMAVTLHTIPSTVTTILKLRSGVLPSLRDERFKQYRGQMYHPTQLLGVMFWGLLATGLLFFVIFGGIVFLYVWQVTRYYALLITAQLIGVGLTAFLKYAFTYFAEGLLVAFYRKRPAVSNMISLSLEVWNLGIAVGFVLFRVFNFVVASAFYVGRIDKPFISDNARYVGASVASPLSPWIGEDFFYDLDVYARYYRSNILSVEAHRHPFMERLGIMYLMKLQHGADFANRAGSAWRLMFVLTLMPWLRLSKYRVTSKLHAPLEPAFRRFANLQEQNVQLRNESVCLLRLSRVGPVVGTMEEDVTED